MSAPAAVWPLAVGVLVFVPMIAEALRAARNERGQLSRGGIEPPGDVHHIMRVAYPASFLGMIVEMALRGPSWGNAAIAGVMVFVLAKAIKWWAMATLGPCWTFRVIVVPSTARVASGPYRFVNHPNYVGVIGELIGTALITGAIIAGPLAIVGFGSLIWRRLRVEARALDAILGPPAAAAAAPRGRAGHPS